jgi:glycosyltransferase involved in cell wall biosynthesis
VHLSVLDFVARALTRGDIADRDVLEVGSRDVNGSVRPLVTELEPKSYLGVDVEEGPGVDLLVAAEDLEPNSADVIVTTEMLEHARDWRGAIRGIKRALRSDGLLILTTRAPGFPRHEHPEDWWRFTTDDVQAMFRDFTVELLEDDPDPASPGVFLRARKVLNDAIDLDQIAPASAPGADLPRVRFVASDTVGGGLLRSFWPAEALRGTGWDAWASVDWPEGSGDVLVVHRPLARDNLERVRAYQDRGWQVWVDEDDDLTTALEDTENEILREVLTPERHEVHDRVIEQADGLLVSSERLAEVYGPVAKETRLIRNRLPAWVERSRFHKSSRETAVRVGWTGILKTHRQDLRWIRDVAPWAFEGATFVSVGDPETPVFLGLGRRGESFEFQMTPKELYARMARADIGIVPLLPCRFNEAKSWLKALEFMTLGKPVVVTNLPEQARLVRDGVDGFLVGSPEEFGEAVRQLVRDATLRTRMGEAARERAREVGRIDGDEWQEALGITAKVG